MRPKYVISKYLIACFYFFSVYMVIKHIQSETIRPHCIHLKVYIHHVYKKEIVVNSILFCFVIYNYNIICRSYNFALVVL